MKLISIEIKDDGGHWFKTIKIFGLTVYHRHDYTKEYKQRPIGFNAFASVDGEIDEDDWED